LLKNDELICSKDANVEMAEQRTEMANFRTQLALDRTALAWIRTSLMFASFGFGMVGFFRSMQESSPSPEKARMQQDAIYFGAAFVVVGIFAMAFSGLSHWQSLRRLRQGQPPKLTQWPLSIAVAALVVALGLAGLWGIFTR